MSSRDKENTVLVSGNDYTLDCFTNHGNNYRTYKFRKSILVNNGYLCATKIRKWIAKDEPWQDYVPESTKQVIKKINGVEIIKHVGEEYAKQPV